MTELALPDGHIINPVTAELVDLTKPENAARFIAEARALENRLRDARREAEWALVEESQRQGSKTLRFGQATVTISGGPETTYDVEVLAELLAAGLPEERYAEVVRMTVEYKPMVGELKRLATANPVYGEIIARAAVRVEKPFTARVK